MIKTSLVLFTLCALSLLSACYYMDGEVYKADPVAGDPSEATVITNLDTIPFPTIGDSLQVVYTLSIDNGEFYFMDATLDDLTVYSSDSIEGSFWIYPSQSSATELDSLYMDFYHSSNTNTLADLTGYEALITSLSYAIDFSGEVEP